MRRRLFSLFLTLCSALMYGAASGVFAIWPCMFLWPIPLWYLACSSGLRSYEMLLWSVIAPTIALGGFAAGLYGMASGRWWECALVPLALLLCAMLWTALWLFVLQLLVRSVNARSMRLSLCVICSWFYSISLAQISILFHPLVALVELPALPTLLSLLGKDCLLVLVYTSSAVCVGYLLQPSRPHSVAVVLVLSFWLALSAVPRHSWPVPPWLSQVGVIRSRFFAGCSIDETAEHLHKHIADFLQEQPRVKCILMPESTVYSPFFFERWEMLMRRFKFPRPVRCIIGGFRATPTAFYNTAWWVTAGRTISWFDKQHVTPITEYIPTCALGTLLERIYFPQGSSYGICAATGNRVVWELLPLVYVTPYICSELFCAQKARDVYADTLIVALCNSAWAPYRVGIWMARAARLQAIAWQRPILYSSHAVSCFIDQAGKTYPITVESASCGLA